MPELTCTFCGALLDTGHNFCPSCGARATPVEAERSGETDEARSRARLQGAVGSDYRIGRLIGRGGFAEVFEAEDARLGRSVAIKAVRPDLVFSRHLLERFQREARAIAGLRHPHVMEIYTVGEKEGVAFFVMPLIRGESLRQRLGRPDPLPLDEAERIFVEAASGLAAAHEAGMVHRDVKPDNLLLEGEEGRVLIADFGIAKALEDESTHTTGSGVFVGTPQYMSPEQATGDGLDHRSDIYSLGIVAFEMLTGRLPFEARGVQALIAKHLTEQPPPVWTLRAECPERLARIVDRCLAKDPGDRWESLHEMVRVLGGDGELPPPVHLGVPGIEAGRAPPAAGGARTAAEAVAALDAPLVAFRKVAGIVVAALALLALLDVVIGLGGISAWTAVAALVYLAARAQRLWTAGYEWRDLLHGPEPEEERRVISLETPLGALHGEDYGRFGSLVRASTSDRAVILKAFSEVSRQERERYPELHDTVDVLVARVKHLARKVVTLEERVAETAERIDQSRRAGPGADPEIATSALSRQAARLQELNSARDEAAREMRTCVSRLETLREVLTERLRLDPTKALSELGGLLGEAGAYLSQRAG